MNTINKLSLKALLLDTITHLKTGQHLNPHYKATKKRSLHNVRTKDKY